MSGIRRIFASHPTCFECISYACLGVDSKILHISALNLGLERLKAAFLKAKNISAFYLKINIETLRLRNYRFYRIEGLFLELSGGNKPTLCHDLHLVSS